MAVLSFLKVAARDIRVGAVMPSSRYAVDAIMAAVPRSLRTVIEYGPGDGVLTRRLLDRLAPDGRLLAIEANGAFHAVTSRIEDPRLVTVRGDATRADAIAAANGFPKADLVISGIPFSMLPRGLRDATVDMTHALLRREGTFLVYQTSPLMRGHLRRRFMVRTTFEPRNVPPYFIMQATKDL